MAIPTSRTKTAGQITLDQEACNGCGLCISVCSDHNLILVNGKIQRHDHPYFGCMACGHCMAICPTGAIRITGRELSPTDLFPLPPREQSASYPQLLALLQRRRSIREFSDEPVPSDLLDAILTAARTAPMGLPPSDVHVLVLDSRAKTRAFAADFCIYLNGMRWLVADWFLLLMRPFWGKANDELFRGFVRPLLQIYQENMAKGINSVNYDAPLALYFYGSAYCDPADPLIAATYAMLAGESLGLGTCMLGAVHPLIQNGRRAKAFRARHGIRHTSREGLFVIFGFPRVTYRQGIRRSFAAIDTA